MKLKKKKKKIEINVEHNHSSRSHFSANEISNFLCNTHKVNVFCRKRETNKIF